MRLIRRTSADFAPFRVLPLALAFVLTTGAATVQQSAFPYRRGETVEISGTVADASGDPVEGVTVVLLASHQGFTLRNFRKVEEGLVRVPTKTDAQGGFDLVWRWDPYYDTFKVRAEGMIATPATAGGGSRRGVLAEVDLTRRIGDGSPVVVALEVADAGPHRQDRSFTETSQSDDQRRVFEENGKPDRVDRLEMPGGDEVAWWYFERGKSYHFRAGRLDQVMEFDPVTGF